MICSSVLPGYPTVLLWDLLVIDRSVVLTQDETPLAFRDLQGSVTAHQKCGFNRQGMAVLQSRYWKLEAVGGVGGERFVSSVPMVPLVSGDYTAPC